MAMIPPQPAPGSWAARTSSRAGRRRARLDARRLLKQALASALSGTGADAMLGSMRRGSAPLVIAYHRVVESYAESSPRGMPGMLVSRGMLERHLDRIGRRYRFVSLDDIGAALSRRGRARAVAAVTFDDGYRDVYEQAFPLLVRKGIPAAVFVVSDLVGTEGLQMHDRLFLLLTRAVVRWPHVRSVFTRRMAAANIPAWRRDGIHRASVDAMALTRALLQALTLAHLLALMEELETLIGAGDPRDRPELFSLTWKMLAEMRATGMTIGSHTRSHALLGHETAEVQAQEIDGSRRRLEKGLACRVTHFAYPDGSFNAAAVQAVADAGYDWAYTACPHHDPRHPSLTISRRVLWEHSSVNASGEFAPAILDCQMQGFFSGRRDCRRRSHA